MKKIKKCVDKNTTIISVLNGLTVKRLLVNTMGEKSNLCGCSGMDAMKFGTSQSTLKKDTWLGITDLSKDKLDKH
ncbi:MAG: hypothetical protein ACLRWM_04415 [Streptococcus sp.]